MQVTTYRTLPTTPASFQLVQAERYHYGVNPAQAPSLLAAFPYIKATLNGATDRPTVYQADYKVVYAYALEQDSTVTTRYDAAGVATRTATGTTYRHWRPVRSVLWDSQGQQHLSIFSYLSDYTPSLPGFTQLRRNNFNPVVEAQHWLRPTGRSDSLLLAGETTHYDPQWQRPATTWKLALAQPQVGLNAQQVVNGYRTSWLSDTHYHRVATEYYDAVTGDPTGQQPTHGATTAYVWGYQRTAPIAQVQNATPTQVAYTGFEALELGRWQGQRAAIAAPGYTGLTGYNLAAGLRCSGLSPGQYVLSCRRQGTTGTLTANGQALHALNSAPAGWTPYTTTVTVGATGTVQVAGTGQIDDVSLYPVGAQLTSYTHDPLVGVTSQTDPAGRTTFYEYDGLGRLVRTRDEQGRILSQQQYHYAGN